MHLSIDSLLILLLVLVIGHVVVTWGSEVYLGRRASRASRASNTPVVTHEQPSTSVLIPAWNEAGSLALTLGALQMVAYPQWEIILIAGGSDGTYARALELAGDFTACPLLVIEQLPRGKNAALNQGLRHTRYDVIVILDGDTLVEPDWLTQLVGVLDGTVAAGCGNYFPLRLTWVSLLEQMEKISSYQVHQRVILQGSGSIVVRRATLDRIGGFPEDVKVGVDWDLSHRIEAPKVFARDARVKTQRPTTFLQFWKNEVRWRRAHLHFLLRQSRVPLTFLRGSLFYIVALAPCVGLLLALALLVIGYSAAALVLLKLTAIFLLWVLGRRAALVGEIAAYTSKASWLRLLGVPSGLLLVSFAASWVALMTLSRQTIHFKGPRS